MPDKTVCHASGNKARGVTMLSSYHRPLTGLLSFLMVVLTISTSAASAMTFNHADIDYKVCFTPPGNCTALIVDAINNATKTIYVQAYSFTSGPIIHALVVAADRGVAVKVILDKSQVDSKKYTSSRYLLNNNIPVWVDYKPAIAHNKVMIIDESVVITGSFNFTNAAQYKNAENLLILKNPAIAADYLKNWQARLSESDDVAASHQRRHARRSSKSGFIKGYQSVMQSMFPGQ